MISRVPRFKKVLFCIPLRYGVVFLVFLNLLLAAAATFLFGYLDLYKTLYRFFVGRLGNELHHMYRSKVTFCTMLLTLVLYAAFELVMTIVVLVAIFKVKQKLLKFYLYYTVIVTVFMIFSRMVDIIHFVWYIDTLIAITFLLLKLYYILSIRSLIKSSDDKKDDLIIHTWSRADSVDAIEMGQPIDDDDDQMKHKVDWEDKVE